MKTDDAEQPPDFDAVIAAAERLRGRAAETPVLTSPVLDAATGARVFLKAENLQYTGSFKFRGAYNRLAQIPEGERGRGVVAQSSGNHAQGVAEAARLLGMRATIVMPEDVPAEKLAGVRERGGRVVFYDRATEDRDTVFAAVAEETGAHVAPPFDHPHTIAGQGTAALEFARQLAARGETLDALLCPVSGGGLIAGVALAFEHESPATEILAVEPAGFDDLRRSLAAGRRVRNAASSGSLCDALLAPTPGALTFAIIQRLLAGGVVVTDAEALAAVAFAYRRMKIVLEPGGAAALAAVLTGKRDLRGKAVGVILSGGNVDAAVFRKATQSASS